MTTQFATPESGFRLIDGAIVAALMGLGGLNTNVIAAATPSGTQDDSEPLLYGLNSVTSSAADTDGVLMPPAAAGQVCIIRNADAAQDIVLFGRGDDTVNGTAGATGVALGQGLIAIAVCVTAGDWRVGVLSNTLN